MTALGRGSDGAHADVLIACKGLAKNYESGAGVVRALVDIDLEIRHGEFVAIVGTSGSGKSTFMNILGCLDRPTRGRYELAGFDVGGRSGDARAVLRNRLIGFIFQGYNLLPRTTALENVELPLLYRGVGSRERRRRALEALHAVGLSERLHHTPNQLSGGQQQRVAIARALVTGPPMLLADEPTGNLDTRTSLEVLALLQRLNRERGITIVLVTHEQDIASCASRVVTFRDGRIVSDVRAEPVDAAAELAALPPVAVSDQRSSEQVDPVVSEPTSLGGPVPRRVYLVMAAAGVLGLGLGTVYRNVVLEARSWLVPIAFAFVCEAMVGAWYGRRAVGRPLTADQRARVAIGYTVVVALLVAPLTAFGWMPWSGVVLDRLEELPRMRALFAISVTLIALATVALVRYASLAVLSPLVASEPARRDRSAG